MVLIYLYFMFIPGLDVVRTDRTLVFYEKQQNLSKLWDVLAVYAWYDSDVGYCQGESQKLTWSDICSSFGLFSSAVSVIGFSETREQGIRNIIDNSLLLSAFNLTPELLSRMYSLVGMSPYETRLLSIPDEYQHVSSNTILEYLIEQYFT